MDVFNNHRAQKILRGREDLAMDGHIQNSYRFEKRLVNNHGINGSKGRSLRKRLANLNNSFVNRPAAAA
ncbi:hypothetical protein SDC9_190929 [bioreactor metagenome]|uniref:Uncharacterized protein n=1 Tax=bioreactor metagenome TaxID=1076179 RepID=A0A645HWX8_9ZZZZ